MRSDMYQSSFLKIHVDAQIVVVVVVVVVVAVAVVAVVAVVVATTTAAAAAAVVVVVPAAAAAAAAAAAVVAKDVPVVLCVKVRVVHVDPEPVGHPDRGHGDSFGRGSISQPNSRKESVQGETPKLRLHDGVSTQYHQAGANHTPVQIQIRVIPQVAQGQHNIQVIIKKLSINTSQKYWLQIAFHIEKKREF